MSSGKQILFSFICRYLTKLSGMVRLLRRFDRDRPYLTGCSTDAFQIDIPLQALGECQPLK